MLSWEPTPGSLSPINTRGHVIQGVAWNQGWIISLWHNMIGRVWSLDVGSFFPWLSFSLQNFLLLLFAHKDFNLNYVAFWSPPLAVRVVVQTVLMTNGGICQRKYDKYLTPVHFNSLWGAVWKWKLWLLQNTVTSSRSLMNSVANYRMYVVPPLRWEELDLKIFLEAFR